MLLSCWEYISTWAQSSISCFQLPNGQYTALMVGLCAWMPFPMASAFDGPVTVTVFLTYYFKDV